MISLIIPTRNRAHTLVKTAESYFGQELVSEIIFVIDQGTDETKDLMLALSKDYPNITLKIIENASRQGASQSRNIGVQASSNDLILFCDDDEYLESNYAESCLRRLGQPGIGAVSGRRIYMFEGETISASRQRFGEGIRSSKPFNYLTCEFLNGAKYQGDIELPFTNAIILTRKALLLQFPFDPFYARGNGFREETDFQMNIFVNGYRILATNACHSFHLPMSEVRTGGQRVSRWSRIRWSIFYTHYFFKKYYARYAERVGIEWPMWVAMLCTSVSTVFRETLRPIVYRAWKFKVSRMSRVRSA